MFNFTPTVAYTCKDSCGSTVLCMCLGEGRGGMSRTGVLTKKVAFASFILKENIFKIK